MYVISSDIWVIGVRDPIVTRLKHVKQGEIGIRTGSDMNSIRFCPLLVKGETLAGSVWLRLDESSWCVRLYDLVWSCKQEHGIGQKIIVFYAFLCYVHLFSRWKVARSTIDSTCRKTVSSNVRGKATAKQCSFGKTTDSFSRVVSWCLRLASPTLSLVMQTLGVATTSLP